MSRRTSIYKLTSKIRILKRGAKLADYLLVLSLDSSVEREIHIGISTNKDIRVKCF